MITLDGSIGEGGGQILRSALALSACTGQPFAIHSIRQQRKKPGLLRQHLTAVLAAQEVAGAEVEGAAIGSRALTFRPRSPRSGEFHFAVGSAGSTTLVLQTVLPPLLCSDGASRVHVTGGTHNPWAPPYDFLALAFLPLLARAGRRASVHLHRPGFFPAGGGHVELDVEPGGALQPFELLERGALRRRYAIAAVAHLDASIAERELRSVRQRLGFDHDELAVNVLRDSRGPGNVLTIVHEFEHVTQVHTGFGERGVSAEHVAERAAAEAERYLRAAVPAGEHLADQLLLPLALAGGGAFRTVAPTEHTTTNIGVIERFLPVRFDLTDEGDDRIRIAVRR